MKKGLTVISYALAILGGWALIEGAGELAAIGVLLVVWANNVYEDSRRY